MKVDLTLLEKRADQIHARYGMRFANKARITRELSTLDELIEETGALLDEIDVPEAESLRETLNERLHMYHQEREAIASAKAAGPEAIEASALGLRANFVIYRYRRHFAGKSRKTRDLGLLAECVDELKALGTRMNSLALDHRDETLARDIEVVERSIRLYVRERGEIVAARGMGLIDQKAELLAELANAQFALYRLHFAGKNRLSRRPGLVQRLIDNLEQIRDRMRSHKQAGLRSPSNDQNIRTITDYLKLYRKEKLSIANAREEATTQELIDALANAANEVMSRYHEHFAGQSRATRDLELLSGLCDQLGELERLMHDVDIDHDHPINRKNLSIVRDMLSLYEREYTEIQKSRA